MTGGSQELRVRVNRNLCSDVRHISLIQCMRRIVGGGDREGRATILGSLEVAWFLVLVPRYEACNPIISCSISSSVSSLPDMVLGECTGES